MLRNLQTLWRLMEGNRLRYAMAIGAMVLATGFMYVTPPVFQNTLDFVLGDKPLDVPPALRSAILSIGERDFWRSHLFIPAAMVVAFSVLGGGFSYLHGRWSAIASESASQRLRDRLYGHLHRLPCTYFDKSDTGDLVQRCTSDVETLRMFLSVQISQIARSVIMVAGVLPFMLATNLTMTWVSLATTPIIVTFAMVFFASVRRTFKKADEAEGRMTAMLQENLTNIRVVRAFARQDFESRKFSERNAEYRNHWFRLVRRLAMYWSSSDLICLSQTGAVLGTGAYLVSRGSLTIGQLVAFNMYVGMFLWPVRHLGRVLNDLGKATVSIGRLEEILHAEEEADRTLPATSTDVPSRAAGRIEFRHVTFGHDEQRHALQDVCFSIEPGQTLAVMGPSGSGKSTIVNLLLRMYEFTEGEILLDGEDIRRRDRRWVRSQFGAVLQEPFLYSRSLRDNIRFGRSSAADDEIETAVQIACMHESIRQFDEGYDTMVGERGVTLSGGQRQRVALARAILRNPPVLVLDDALSAVDTETERMILAALSERHGERTTIVIAHRVSTLMHADKILVLQQGHIAQQGTHRQLISEDGMYRRLWDIQHRIESDVPDETPADRTGDAGQEQDRG